MALIHCPECGKEISDNAKKCPHCGMKLKKGFFQSHKLLVAATISGTLLAGGAVAFFSTHTIVSYGENVAVKGVRQLEKNIINEESIDIEKLRVGYVYPEKLDGLLYESEQKNLKKLYKEDFTNVWIKYRFLNGYGSIEESEALVVLNKDLRTIYITTNLEEAEDSTSRDQDNIYEYDILEMAALQKQTKDYHNINLNKKAVKKALSGKNKLVVNSKYQDNKRETDRALLRMIKYTANEGWSYWDDRGAYCLEKLSSNKDKKEALEIRDDAYYEYSKEAYKGAKKYRENGEYVSEVDQLEYALKILDRTENRNDKVEELDEKCKKRLDKACYKAAKQTYQNIEYNASDEENNNAINGLSDAIEYLDKIENKDQKVEELRADYQSELEPLCYDKAQTIYLDLTEDGYYYTDELTYDIGRMEEAVEAVNKIENTDAEASELKEKCLGEMDLLYYYGAEERYDTASQYAESGDYAVAVRDYENAIEYLDKISNQDDDSTELKAKCQKEKEEAEAMQKEADDEFDEDSEE